jgi:hypothetical protein
MLLFFLIEKKLKFEFETNYWHMNHQKLSLLKMETFFSIDKMHSGN